MRVGGFSMLAGPADDVATLRRTLHDLTLAIQAASASGQTQAATLLRQQWDAVNAQLQRIVATQNAADQPSGFSLGLMNLGDTLTAALKPLLWYGALAVGGYFAIKAYAAGRRRNG